MSSPLSREITCPNCKKAQKLPVLWVFGIEVPVVCPKCKRNIGTGYKMGALLFALSLTLALVTINLLVYMFSSRILAFMIVAIVPLWLLYGFVLRKLWIMVRPVWAPAKKSRAGKPASRTKKSPVRKRK